MSHLCKILRLAGLPGMMLLICTVILKMIARRRDINDYNDIDSSSVIKVVIIFLIALVLFYYFIRKNCGFFWLQYIKFSPLKYFVFYTILSCISCLWSDQKLYSAWMAFETIVYGLLCITVVRNFKNHLTEAILFVLYWGIWSSLVSLIVTVCRGDLATFFTVQGLHGFGSLTIGPLLGLALFYPTKKRLKIVYICLALIGTSSSVYIGILIAFFFAGLYSSKRYLYILAILFVVSCYLLGLVINKGDQKFLSQIFFPGKEVTTIETGTGRDWLYDAAFRIGMEHPVRGWGFANTLDAFQNSSSVAIPVTVQSIHNSFIEAFISTGFFGLILMCIFFYEYIRIPMKYSKDNPVWFAFFVNSIIVMVISFFNPAIGGRVTGAWLPVIFTAVLIVHTKFEIHSLDLSF